VATQNPFRPRFGQSPPVLVGRDDLLDELLTAHTTQRHRPSATALVTGERGMGKTALMNEVQKRAEGSGCFCLPSVAVPEGPLLPTLMSACADFLRQRRGGWRRRVTAVELPLGLGGLSVQDIPQQGHGPTLRKLLTEAAELRAVRRRGLLVTVDELHMADISDIRALGSVLQHVAHREERPVFFLGAGLPSLWHAIVHGEAATFLRRCWHKEIGRLDALDTRRAFADSARLGGGRMLPDALSRLSEASKGYPHHIQLFGHESWNLAKNPASGITLEDAEAGIRAAIDLNPELAMRPVLDSLPDMEHRFLAAMALDPEGVPTSTKDLRERLDRNSRYVSVYRQRLIEKGIIASAGRGLVMFTSPYVREWLTATPLLRILYQPATCAHTQLNDKTATDR